MNAHRTSLRFRARSTAVLNVLASGALAASVVACAAQVAPPEEPAPSSESIVRPALTASNSPEWHSHIVAPEAELAWEQIPWRPSFLTGLRDAAAANKPLLLWVMNGHPLGCT